jgi:pimeloyl-ACP methyl ester carboxylesterase
MLTRISTAALWLIALDAIQGAGNPTDPCKPKSGYLDAGGSKIYYEECGRGPETIVLLHDGLLGAVSWDAIWETLATKYHVVRYDRRGYGRSEPPTSAFSPNDDLLKLLVHLKVQRAVVVGSSSGGALAIDFAIEHPNMVDGLFLIGPVLHGIKFSNYFVERANRNNAPMEQRGDLKAVAKNWSEDKYLIAGGHEEARKKVYDALVMSPQNFEGSKGLEQTLTPPASERLTAIKAPTLILAGEADIADVHAHCGAINAGIRDSTRSVIKDAGHLVQLEKPEEIAKLVREFAERCARKH